MPLITTGLGSDSACQGDIKLLNRSSADFLCIILTHWCGHG